MKILTEEEVALYRRPIMGFRARRRAYKGDWERILATLEAYHQVKCKSANRKKALRNLLKAYAQLKGGLYSLLIKETKEGIAANRAKVPNEPPTPSPKS